MFFVIYIQKKYRIVVQQILLVIRMIFIRREETIIIDECVALIFFQYFCNFNLILQLSLNLEQDDVKLLKRMNVQAYRLSIAWSRVLPSKYKNRKTHLL